MSLVFRRRIQTYQCTQKVKQKQTTRTKTTRVMLFEEDDTNQRASFDTDTFDSAKDKQYNDNKNDENKVKRTYLVSLGRFSVSAIGRDLTGFSFFICCCFFLFVLLFFSIMIKLCSFLSHFFFFGAQGRLHKKGKNSHILRQTTKSPQTHTHTRVRAHTHNQ